MQCKFHYGFAFVDVVLGNIDEKCKIKAAYENFPSIMCLYPLCV